MRHVFLRYRRLIYAQVVLGLAAFSIALSDPAFLLLVGAVAAGSWYLVEGPSGRSLPRFVTNLGALAAIAWLLIDLRLRGTPGLVAIGHFMIWLQLLLLYGRRGYRDDAMALVLSLLLMVDASLLSFSMVYGLLLAVYSLLMVWTLLAFSFSSTADEVARWMRLTLADDQTQESGIGPALVGGSRMRRDVLRVGVVMSLGAFATAALVFVLTPRIEGLSDVTATRVLSSVASIGFDSEMQLGRRLEEPDSQEPVLLVAMRDAEGHSVGSNSRVWYLRGASMDQYDPYLRTWYRAREVGQHDLLVQLRGNPPSVAIVEPGTQRSFIEAEITIRHPHQDHLFTPFPPLMVQSDGFRYAVFNAIDQQLFSQHRNNRTLRYTVRHAYPASADRAVFRDYRRLIGRRPSVGASAPDADSVPEFDPERYARGWNVQVAQVRAMAMEILEQAGLQRDPSAAYDPRDAAIAEVLTGHLRSNYLYRTTAVGADGPTDPILTFLLTRREGHCELFAAGLAALARSIGMRARLVGGYLASEYNQAGGYYIVRPGNAHAWCEIEIERDVWQRFDPTPPAGRDQQHHVASTWGRQLRQLYEHLDFLWIRSVVAYDPRTQRAAFDTAYQTLLRAVSVESGLTRKWRQIISSEPGAGGSRLGFVLAGLLILAFAAAAAFSLAGRRRGRRKGRGADRTRARRDSLARVRGQPVAFYEAMSDLLARHGYERPSWMGPRQFAQDLASLHPGRFDSALALTDLFYAVRFGGCPLEESQRLEARQWLEALDRQLGDGETPPDGARG